MSLLDMWYYIVKPRFLSKTVDLWSYIMPIDRYIHYKHMDSSRFINLYQRLINVNQNRLIINVCPLNILDQC